MRSSKPVLLRAMRARTVAAQTVIAPARPIAFAPFSSSSRFLQQAEQKSQDDKKQEQQQQRKGPTPEEGHGPAKSPFAVFAQVLKEEISKNKAWQENVKTLQGDVDKLADTQAMKRARDMYEKARVRSFGFACQRHAEARFEHGCCRKRGAREGAGGVAIPRQVTGGTCLRLRPS